MQSIFQAFYLLIHCFFILSIVRYSFFSPNTHWMHQCFRSQFSVSVWFSTIVLACSVQEHSTYFIFMFAFAILSLSLALCLFFPCKQVPNNCDSNVYVQWIFTFKSCRNASSFQVIMTFSCDIYRFMPISETFITVYFHQHSPTGKESRDTKIALFFKAIK